MNGKKLGLILLFTTRVCLADSADSDLCSSEEMNSQEIYECSKQARKGADTELNNAYKALNDQISDDFRATPLERDKLKSSIQKSQKAWIILRDANCAVESFVIAPGTQAFETTKNHCFTRESIERIRYLKSLRF